MLASIRDGMTTVPKGLNPPKPHLKVGYPSRLSLKPGVMFNTGTAYHFDWLGAFLRW